MAAVVVVDPAQAQSGKGGKTWGVMDMRRALKDKLANYKIPQELRVIEELPKNAMGKGEILGCPTMNTVLTFGQSIRKIWSRRSLGMPPELVLSSGIYSCTCFPQFL